MSHQYSVRSSGCQNGDSPSTEAGTGSAWIPAWAVGSGGVSIGLTSSDPGVARINARRQRDDAMAAGSAMCAHC